MDLNWEFIEWLGSNYLVGNYELEVDEGFGILNFVC